MNIVNGYLKGLQSGDVAIKSRAFLPEAETALAWSLTYRAPLQQGTLRGHEKPLNLNGIGLLPASQHLIDLRLRQLRVDQEMDVLGHIHKRDDVKCQFTTCPVDMGRQALPEVVSIEQRQAAITRKGQFVVIARFVVVA